MTTVVYSGCQNLCILKCKRKQLATLKKEEKKEKEKEKEKDGT